MLNKLSEFVYSVNGHIITVGPDGAIGECPDCMDYSTRKKEHQGWCYHRLAVLLATRPEKRESPDVIDITLALSKRIKKAIDQVTEKEREDGDPSSTRDAIAACSDGGRSQGRNGESS